MHIQIEKDWTFSAGGGIGVNTFGTISKLSYSNFRRNRNRVTEAHQSGLSAPKRLESGEPDSLRVVLSVSSALCDRTAADIGTKKLSGVFQRFSANGNAAGFLVLLNFSHILTAKGAGWKSALSDIIVGTDRKSYYLNAMLSRLMSDLRNEINTGRDRDQSKELVALIQAKRTGKTNAPGAKLISRVLRQMEDQGHFLTHITDEQRDEDS